MQELVVADCSLVVFLAGRSRPRSRAEREFYNSGIDDQQVREHPGKRPSPHSMNTPPELSTSSRLLGQLLRYPLVAWGFEAGAPIHRLEATKAEEAMCRTPQGLEGVSRRDA